MRDHRPRLSAKVAPVTPFLLPRLFAVPEATSRSLTQRRL